MFFRKKDVQSGRLASPEIHEEDLCNGIRELHFKILNAFQDKKPEEVKAYLSDETYENMRNILEDFRNEKKTNYTENLEIVSVRLKDVYQKENMTYAVCELYAAAYNYTLDDVNGKLLAGSRDEKRDAVFEYLLVSRADSEPYENGLGFLITSLKRTEK